MKKKAILYNPIIKELKYIAYSKETDDYSVVADLSGKLTEFVNLIEEFEDFIKQLEKAKRKMEIFINFPLIHEKIKNFCDLFANFPKLNREKLLLQVTLRQQIASVMINNGIALDDKDVATGSFIVSKLDENICQEFFEYYNANDLANCALFFSLKDYEFLKKTIEKTNLNPDFFYQILLTIDSNTDISLGNQYVVTKKPKNPSMVADFLKLLLVCKGKYFHEVHNYSAVPQVINPDKIRIAVDYRQQRETINVLNEYNSRNELLTKYLTIYQIIESFMYKVAIVGLESKAGGKIFSIRDFRFLYKEVDLNESKALEKLFKAVLNDEPNPGTSLKTIFQSDWRQLTRKIPQAEIDKILFKLKLKLTYQEINRNRGDFEKNMSTLVYKMRNSIVHNAETEFHLTNFEITPGIKELIISFLFPMLERLVFHLISSRNNHIWYTNKNINMF